MARKGRIRPFCANTAHSISSADSTGFQDIFHENISAAVPSLRQHPSRSAKENTNRFLDSIYDVDYQGKGAPPPEVGFGTQHVRGGRGIPTPVMPDLENIRKPILGHSMTSYSQNPYSDITESTLTCQAAISNIFFNTDNHEMEESMKNYPTHIHHHHPFKELIRTLGSSRPEIKDLVEFVRFSRKSYVNAKKLKVRIENKDGLLSPNNIKEFIDILLDSLHQLEVYYN